MKVGILTDTTACIPPALIEELGIELVPYYVMRGMETLRDMVDVQPDEFAQYLLTAQTMPTTSNPSPGDYVNAILRLAERSLHIVALTMTSKGSGAYQSCLAAVEMLREKMPKLRVDVVDTLAVAMAQGWAVIEAARAAKQGLEIGEVVAKARQVARQSMMMMTADSLRYLYLGGRIGKAQHLIGSLLNIKPIIGMQDGVIVALATERTRPKAYGRIIELMKERLNGIRNIKVAFMHVAALDQLDHLKDKVCAQFNCVETLTTPLSPALAVHSGPGTVGLSYIPENVT
ncbi:MAG: DegV family protein [Anaerolineales bacterium]